MAALVGEEAASVDGLPILAPAILAALVAVKRRCGSWLVAHIVASARTFLVIWVSGLAYFRFVDPNAVFYGLERVLLLAISAASSLGAAVVALLFQLFSQWRGRDLGRWIPIAVVFLGYWGSIVLLVLVVSLLTGRPGAASQVLRRVVTLDSESLKLVVSSLCTTAVFAVYWLSLRFTKPTEEDNDFALTPHR